MSAISKLATRRPELAAWGAELERLVSLLCGIWDAGGTLYVCGNGGSAADAEHIVGELQKSFLLPRPITLELSSRLVELFGEDGKAMAVKLQRGLRAVCLGSHPSLLSAFANDVSAELTYAQHVSVLGRPGDALLAISTSGNSRNIVSCLMIAKAMGLKSAVLTGAKPGLCDSLADIIIRSPATETYLVQEDHVAIYHAVCAAVEERYYG